MRYFPEDPKKILQKLRRTERALKSDFRDGVGRRFLIGPMYMLLGDLEGATKYYNWYKRKYPDDMPDAFSHLMWVLCLYRNGNKKAAESKLHETILSNLYVIPALLMRDFQKLDIWHGCNLAEPEYITEGPLELFEILQKDELNGVASFYDGDIMTTIRARFIEIERALKDTPVGPLRSRLVEEAFQLRKPEKQNAAKEGFLNSDDSEKLLKSLLNAKD